MLEKIYLPQNIEILEEEGNSATFNIHPYHPGYGPTVGNALRRVLLSSLPGSAITDVKIEKVDHEFSASDGVKEDMLTVLLNLKQVRLSSEGDEPAEINLKVSGKKKVTAGDFETPPDITVANPELLIATLTDEKASLEMHCTVERGRGYVPAETGEREQREIGRIAVDSIFTPVKRVSFGVENARVGQATDYHKLALTIETDGTVSPKEALQQAASILRDHFAELTGDFEIALTGDRPEEVHEPTIEEEPSEPENTLNLLQLPSRVHNALERIGITTVEQVMELTDEQIQDIPGLGEKAVNDIKDSRDKYAESEKVMASKEVEREDEA